MRAAVELRLAEVEGALDRPEIEAFLEAQRAATERLQPEVLAEIEGLGTGFGIEPARLFAFLHASVIAELLEGGAVAAEGCTAFAVRTSAGALLAKNRDYRDEHRALQQVMLHRPARGRSFLVVGSLGAPGCFSSGINEDGLALADTAAPTRDLGPGLNRYFLTTLLLERCATVDEALALVRATPHTGSGCLVLADAAGALAAVELGHRQVGIERGSGGRIGRTNHHRLPETAPANLSSPRRAAAHGNSIARQAALGLALDRLADPPGPDGLGALLGRHADAEGPAFCRHGGDDLAATISGALFDTARRQLAFCAGPPCSGAWRTFDLHPTCSGSPAP
ncbi:MAG: C45 family peptidase [Geminicoccaceae bacterium]|nr:C45 family peptidase [Geminicoccaceae bacterium]